MIKQSKRCGKLTWIIRILLWSGMLLFWVMKLWGSNPMLLEWVENLRSMWLNFLSVSVLYRLAAIWEVVAWILLLTWYKTKLWAWLTLIIMITAIVSVWVNPLAILFSVAAVYLIYAGSGSWAVSPCGCCGSKFGWKKCACKLWEKCDCKL